MKIIPETTDALVLRTDFSNDAAWESICTAIQVPVPIPGLTDEFKAYVEFLSDPEYQDLTIEQLLTVSANHTFIFIVDKVALSQPDYPILVVDLYDEPGRTFRVIPAEMGSVENNLSLANMDFYEFAEVVDSDGVFRGGLA